MSGFLIATLVLCACWLWLFIRAITSCGGLAGVVAFVFWPANLIHVVKTWGDGERSLAMPYFATAFATLLVWYFSVGAMSALMQEADRIAAAEDTGVSSLTAGLDPISGRVRYAQAMANVAFQRGEVSVPQAEALIDVPTHFRFAPRPGLAAMAAQLGGELPAELVGWVVHDSVDLARDDAWVVSVSYEPIGHVAESDLEDLGDPTLAQRTLDYTARHANGEFRFVSFAHPPAWNRDTQVLTWGENIAWSDESETVDCYASKPTRAGVLRFTVEDFERSRSELCLRAVRLLAAKTRFREGHGYEDYSFFSDKRSGSELVDLVSGAAYE